MTMIRNIAVALCTTYRFDDSSVVGRFCINSFLLVFFFSSRIHSFSLRCVMWLSAFGMCICFYSYLKSNSHTAISLWTVAAAVRVCVYRIFTYWLFIPRECVECTFTCSHASWHSTNTHMHGLHRSDSKKKKKKNEPKKLLTEIFAQFGIDVDSIERMRNFFFLPINVNLDRMQKMNRIRIV